MKRLALLLVLVLPAVAYAQGAPPPPPPPPPGGGAGGPVGPAPGPGTVWVGGSFGILPSGSFNEDDGMGSTVSSDLAMAYALNAIVEYQLSPLISIGLNPRYVFNVIPSDATGDAASMLDLRARVSAGQDVAPQIRVYGFAAVGWSIIYPPSSAMSSVNSSGPTATGGAGVSYAVNPRLRMFGEGGYEVGFQSISQNGVSVDAKAQYLELNVGIQAAFGG